MSDSFISQPELEGWIPTRLRPTLVAPDSSVTYTVPSINGLNQNCFLLTNFNVGIFTPATVGVLGAQHQPMGSTFWAHQISSIEDTVESYSFEGLEMFFEHEQFEFQNITDNTVGLSGFGWSAPLGSSDIYID